MMQYFPKPFMFCLLIICVHLCSSDANSLQANVAPSDAQKLYDRVTPSLVAVKFTWESELGRRELVGAGVVVSPDGLIMSTLAMFDLRIPDDQMTDFKIIIPRQDADNEEIEAVFQGRDERTNLAFVRPVETRAWKPIDFADKPLAVGDAVLSVGLLPEVAGYKTYLAQGHVSALLRGDTPQVLVTEGVAAMGSPVFNTAGEAVGLVNVQAEQMPFLNDPRSALAAITDPPKFFVPTRDFTQSLASPPVAGQPIKLPWMGIPQLTGLKKDVAAYFGLENQPAVEVGDIIPGTPAENAGLKPGWIIVKVNGKPIERGDQPEELPLILRRQIMRMAVGDKVVLSVMTGKDQPLKDVEVTLEEQPERANTAKRFWAEDLGFSVRQIVFFDLYFRKLPQETKGVVVGLIKPQGAAQNARLEMNDLITEMNREPVTDVEQFKAAYETFRKTSPKEAVVLVVIRDARTETVRIEPPQ
jgi:serine protease Do